ncbi:hypothetical protein NX722_28495 [Endozoicomonas gorgoniicola]|uniref:Uncharacterized protein n=1 Tax=Endozoicomonas gorgoniicola TaxID=1234144 RepID=A0ABT3N4E3_9GAMM|nr:hypothetical protein [Endozoicomonas gorgoniicola]MCW7556507.1 hypothetical protein [Endozoicomonas gorgoniicola]
MFTKRKNRSVKEVYESVVSELKEIEKEQQEEINKCNGVIQTAQKRLGLADDEISKARLGIKGFAEMFGLKAQEQ